MKAKLFSVMMGLLIIANTQAQRRVTVEAVNNDISYYLDLKAVAYIFGESETLEDFEYKLNDPESNISNLDLNGDGYIDYLRVIENNERNVHLLVIQALLDRDVYQDVATIAVGKSNYNKLNIQVVGDPYIYGNNYIIEPYYYRTPLIVRWFWSPYYSSWHSPYYWGYYPRHYHYRSPIEINIYMGHVHRNIYRVENHYRYSDNYRFRDYDRLHSSVRRNDFARSHPDRAFTSRNKDVTNRRALEPVNRNNNNQRVNDDVYNRRNNTGSRENNEQNRRTDANNRTNNTPRNGRVETDNQRNSRNESGRTENSGNRVSGNNPRENSGATRPSTNSNTPNRRTYENNSTNTQRDNSQNRPQAKPEQRSSRTETRPAPESPRQQPTVKRESPKAQPTPRVSTPSTNSRSSAPAQNNTNSSRSKSDNSNSRSNNQGSRR